MGSLFIMSYEFLKAGQTPGEGLKKSAETPGEGLKIILIRFRIGCKQLHPEKWKEQQWFGMDETLFDGLNGSKCLAFKVEDDIPCGWGEAFGSLTFSGYECMLWVQPGLLGMNLHPKNLRNQKESGLETW